MQRAGAAKGAHQAPWAFTFGAGFRAYQSVAGTIAFDQHDETKEGEEGERHDGAPRPGGDDEEENGAGSGEGHSDDGEDAPSENPGRYGAIHGVLRIGSWAAGSGWSSVLVAD